MKRMPAFALSALLLMLTIVSVHAQDAATRDVRSESEGLTLTLAIPAEWAAEAFSLIGDFPAIAFAPVPEMIDLEVLQGNEPPTFTGDQVTFIASLSDEDSFGGYDTSGGVGTMMQSWVDTFGSNLGQTSAVEVVDFPGGEGARVTVDAETLSFVFMIMDVGESQNGTPQYIIFYAFAAPGAVGDADSTLLTVASTVQVLENDVPRFGGAIAPTTQPRPPVSGDSFMTLLAALPVPSSLDMEDAEEQLDNVLYLDLEALGDRSTETLVPYGMVISDLLIADENDMKTAIGVGLDEIDRIMVYGTPPTRMTIIEGEFDPEAIETALTEVIGLAREEVSGYPLFCHPAGCDRGFQVDVRGRNLGNPFGGNIGRREAFALVVNPDGPDRLIVSPAALLVIGTLDRLGSGDVPAVDFVPPTVMDAGVLLAAVIYNGARISDSVDDLAFTVASNDPLTTVVHATFNTNDAAAFTTGLDEALERESLVSQLSYAQLFADRAITVTASSESGRTVAISFTGTETGANAFALLTAMLSQRDLGWLTGE